MATKKLRQVMYDPRNGGEPIRLQEIPLTEQVLQPARTNYFSIYLVQSGSGNFWADAARFPFGPNSLLFFVPYQRIRLEPVKPVQGKLIQFHANFLCVETFHVETGCSGALFNDPYRVPLVQMDASTRREIMDLVERIQREDAGRQTAYQEVMLASLKVLLILATRLKTSTAASIASGGLDMRNPLIVQLKELIEENYQRLHSPSDYARLLHMTPKTLGRIVRDNFGTTPTELIRGRILAHAKWQLLHTLRPVKEIAREVGFQDELYFSRLFKKATGLSPTFFREFETEIRGGSNLSMPLSKSTIPESGAASNTDSRSAQSQSKRKSTRART